MVVNGEWRTVNNLDYCCKTFTEMEPWLEIDLEALHHIRWGR